MMLAFHIDAKALQNQQHFSADILKFIRGWDREITFFVTGFVAQVRTLIASGIPDAFNRIDFIKGPVLGRLETDIVEDEKFRFRSEKHLVCNICRTQVRY